MRLLALIVAGFCAFLGLSRPLYALPPDSLESVVSVLPVWPGQRQGGAGAPPGTAPEGSGVVVGPGGLIATAWHVVGPAKGIEVRLADGRILPAELVGDDPASDIALLRVPAELPVFTFAATPPLASPVCTVANAFGLGLSVTCGVVSALHVTAAGFNSVEDFIQTDAAVNPGSSGGALLDDQGRLVGMLSAIFASDADSNIGINFAVSATLLERVVTDLADDGEVSYVSPAWRLSPLPRARLAELAGAEVTSLDPAGAAGRAGVAIGDIVTTVGDRKIGGPRDAIGALALVPPGGAVEVVLVRDGSALKERLVFGDAATEEAAEAAGAVVSDPDCPFAVAVCASRQAVFPVESFDPLASAVRIGPELLVTNRHVVGDNGTARVYTPDGVRQAEVIPSAYRGDLALLRVEGLPADGQVLAPFDGNAEAVEVPLYAVGADVARQEVRVFPPGGMVLPPADGAPLGRLQVTAQMQPGVSGGALVDEEGRLLGIAIGGGEGHYEAAPADQILALLALSEADDAAAVQAELGAALAACVAALEGKSGTGDAGEALQTLRDRCLAADNLGLLLEAGRALGQAGDFAGAIALHEAAVAQSPNSINAVKTLLVSLQLSGRFDRMLPLARWLFEVLPRDPQALRFAIQSGVWGGDPALAEAAYVELLESDPRQAQAARRFIDQPPPAPPPR